MGCNVANARKLRNIISDFNNRTGYQKIAYFLEHGITLIANLSKMGSTIGGLGGTHPPKTYLCIHHGSEIKSLSFFACFQENFEFKFALSFDLYGTYTPQYRHYCSYYTIYYTYILYMGHMGKQRGPVVRDTLGLTVSPSVLQCLINTINN